MPLDTYANLQTAVLGWLARPGDALVAPAVPDMIRLFEREAARRLRIGAAEQKRALTATGGAAALPSDFVELRVATLNGTMLKYLPPNQLPGGAGEPGYFSLIGSVMYLGPAPANDQTVQIIYQAGLPPLSDAYPSNWLLAQHPDIYLFGTLVEAESYIGHDERIQLWAQRREAAFLSIEQADRKARWSGAPLQIRADLGGSVTASDWGASSSSGGGGGMTIVQTPASGDVVSLAAAGAVTVIYIANAAVLALLTIRLPPAPVDGDVVEISFGAPITALNLTDSLGTPVTGGPTNAYGPGAGLELRFVGGVGWVYWA